MAIESTSSVAPAGSGAVRLRMSTRTRISARDRMLFTERLAMLLETGMALHAALKTLQEQTDNPRLAAVIGEVNERVMAGKPLSVSLAEHPELFSSAYVGLVGAAEQGGFMAAVLQQLVDMEDRQQKFNAALAGALTYPAVLAVFSLAVVGFVLVGVFPKFADMFASISNDLPASTVVLMAVSDFLRGHGVSLLAGSGCLVALALRWARLPQGRQAIDRAKLRTPGLRHVFMQIYMARTMRVMSTSLANGVTVLDTLAACRDAIANREFQQFLSRVEEHVVQGKGFAAAFNADASLPALVRDMISTGEQTGKLAMVMARIADFYERELMRRVMTISKLAEPVMLLVMGGVVGVIVMSLILPIFKLSKAAG